MKTRITLGAAMSAVLLSTLSVAQGADETAAIVVTATRFATTIAAAPVNTTVISAADIRNSTADTLSQLLEQQPGVHVQNLFGLSGARSRLDLGGYGAAAAHNTLLLLNGRRLNDVDLGGANLAAIPLASIERIEIIHGSSTVLYGDNATAGAINIVTRDGNAATRTTVAVQAGSFATRQLELATARAAGDNTFSAVATGRTSDGYRDNSAAENSNALLTMTRQGANRTLGARLFLSDEDVELPGALNEPEYLATPTAAGSASLETADERRITAEGFMVGNHWSAELAWRNKRQNATIYGDTRAELSTVSMTPRYRRRLAAHEVISGIDIYYSTLAAHGTFGGAFPAENDSDTTRNSIAAYASDRYRFHGGTTQAEAGVRVQYSGLEISNTDVLAATDSRDSRDDTLLAWDLGLHHDLGENTRGYLRAASSFRFPVLDELWSYYDGSIALLKPQTATHLEAGLTALRGDRQRATLTLSATDVDDEIGYDAGSFSNVNFDPTRHLAATLALDARPLANWTLHGAYDYRRATFRSGSHKGKVIPEVPLHRLTLSGGHRLSDRQHLQASAVYTGERYFGDDLDNIGRKMAAFTRLDLSWRYQVGGYSLRAAVTNVTDAHDADAGYYGSWSANPYFYYPLPGRGYYLTLETAL